MLGGNAQMNDKSEQCRPPSKS